MPPIQLGSMKFRELFDFVLCYQRYQLVPNATYETFQCSEGAIINDDARHNLPLPRFDLVSESSRYAKFTKYLRPSPDNMANRRLPTCRVFSNRRMSLKEV